MSTRLSLNELETYLYASADILRGHVDASDYKTFVFPLLFFKRICDIYDEETAQLIKEFGADGAKFMGNTAHRFKIPDGHHWRDIRNTTENIGTAIADAFAAVEQSNEDPKTHEKRLLGVFGNAPWGNKNRLPDEMLKNLIEHFSTKTLSMANCPEDELGQAYEYLIKKFGDDSGHTSQEFYTNRTVVHLMTEMLKPQSGETVYDPTCGSAGMLISCIAYLKKQGLEWRGVKCYGQEINPLSTAIGKMNLFLHGVSDFKIVNADTLKYPAFVTGGQLQQFDICLANPPYSISTWNREAFESDLYGRNFLGTPNQKCADYAFIQHIIKSLDPKTGRCAILLPHGVLNRTEEADIRLKLVQMDIVETVIGLGRHLFYNSGLESCILICRMNKPQNQRNKVLFIEAEKYQHRVKGQSYLYDDDIATILKAYNSEEDIPGLSRHVDLSEIVENGGNLNIKSYVKAEGETPTDELLKEQFCDQLDSVLGTTDSFKESIGSYFSDFSWDAIRNEKTASIPSFNKSTWRKVKLGDIAEEYAERVLEPSESQYEWYIGSDCIDGFAYRIARKTPAAKVHSTQKAFKQGDYLLVRRSLYGSDFRERAPRADFAGCCSADILTIREKEDVVADGFLIAVLYSKRLWDFIVANSTGSLTRRIKWSQLKEFELLLPPIGVQEEISDILWAAYEAKTSLQKVLALTDDLVKSQFIEMFGSGNWNKRKLRDLYDIKSSKRIYAKELVDCGIPFLKVADVLDKIATGVCSPKAYITEQQYSDFKRAGIVPNAGDIIVTSRGTIGKCYIIKENDAFYFQDGMISWLKTKPNCMLIPEFTVSLFSENSFCKALDAATNKTTVLYISLDKLADMEVICPPIEKQKEYIDFLQQSDKSKFELKQRIDTIDSVIRSLSQIIVS